LKPSSIKDAGNKNATITRVQTMSEKIMKQCLVCGADSDDIKVYMTLDMCPICRDKEKVAQELIRSTAPERIRELSMNLNLIADARKVDDAIHYNSDFFNAKTVEIVELEKFINADESIPLDQKYFALSREVVDRINKFSGKLFELKTETDNVKTAQVVYQRKLNELAERLTKDEREKLKVTAINYKPQVSKPDKVKVPKLVKKSENYALVLHDYPHISLDDAKLASLYMDLLNRRGKVVTTGDAVKYVKSVTEDI
jgi:hypothetical protein